ncbi:DsbA family protein [Pseudonocardia sp. HH130630-07]|uniref:DsbA family protein n=1 Tax=Pseudonocardia sp. HH130630-07 TaxID=1690815 RepID=UPI0009F5584B|nr:thioredoxin domain-containing protein [Pseudonocardia sp. HH130630-07]
MTRSTRRRGVPSTAPRTGLSNLTFSLVIVAVFVVAVGALLVIGRSGDEDVSDPGRAAAVAVRADSHRLSSAPGATVDFVEFLDFECEACGAVYPVIEQLREQYGDRVNFVIRYFPGPSHANAERAARAVEAAAQQGRLEPMYQRMFETQSEWGEQQVPMDERFRGYARDLGLDLARYDAAYAAPETGQRIDADRRDGYALGVQGTPTFFVDGERLQPETVDDPRRALDEALAEG